MMRRMGRGGGMGPRRGNQTGGFEGALTRVVLREGTPTHSKAGHAPSRKAQWRIHNYLYISPNPEGVPFLCRIGTID